MMWKIGDSVYSRASAENGVLIEGTLTAINENGTLSVNWETPLPHMIVAPKASATNCEIISELAARTLASRVLRENPPAEPFLSIGLRLINNGNPAAT